MRRVARPHMERLVQETEKSVLLGTFPRDRLTIIDKVDPVGTLHVSAAIGQQVPFSAGSFGRVFLAYLPTEQVDRLIAAQGLEAFYPCFDHRPGRLQGRARRSAPGGLRRG